MVGNQGSDRIRLGDSNDQTSLSWAIANDAGNDEIWGGRGNDDLPSGPGRDQVYGGPGADYLGDRTEAGSAGELVLLAGSDRLFGGAGNDTLGATRDGSYVNMGSGDDIACGGPARDSFDGGAGDDRVDVDATSDRLSDADPIVNVETIVPHDFMYCYMTRPLG